MYKSNTSAVIVRGARFMPCTLTDENSGKTTSTTTNTYAINDVPKAYRDFVQYFSEMGIDINSFVILSHPDAFLKDTSSKGREKIREELFKMVSEKTDIDLARSMTGCDEFKALLEKGYNPVNQIVGYIMSGDPTYITSHKGARSLIMKVERDELVEEMLTEYIKSNNWAKK